MCLVGFPIFDGVAGDLRPWISWLEDFFVQEDFTTDEKMNLAQSLLEGEAESWFYRRQNMFLFRSWEHMKDCLLLRFGDFDDPALIRLIAKQDRILMEKRDEARIRRMKTTSLSAQESVSSMAKIQDPIPVEKLPNQQVIVDESSAQATEISGEKKESTKELDLRCGPIGSEIESILKSQPLDVSQSQRALNLNRDMNADATLISPWVTVCTLEPSHRIGREYLDVLEDFPSAIVRETSPQSLNVLDSVIGKQNTHHVFDKLCMRRNKLNQQKKLSLSPKTWMFKYKNRPHTRYWIQEKLWFKNLMAANVDKEDSAQVYRLSDVTLGHSLYQMFNTMPLRRKQMLHNKKKEICKSWRLTFQHEVETSVNRSKQMVKSIQQHYVVYKAGIKHMEVEGRSRASEQASRLQRVLPELDEGSSMEVELAPMFKESDLMHLQVPQQLLQAQQYIWNNDDKAREDKVFFVGDWNYFFSVWHRWRNRDLYHFRLLTHQSLQQIEEYTMGGDHYIFIIRWHIKLFHLQQLATLLHNYEKQQLGDFSQSYLLVAATFWSTKMQRRIASYHVWHRWKAQSLQIFEYKFDAGSKLTRELVTVLRNRGLMLSIVHKLQRRDYHISAQEFSEACSFSIWSVEGLRVSAQRNNVSLG